MTTQQRENYIDAAFNAGAVISKSAYWHQNKCSWLFAAWNESQYRTVFKPMSFDFYEGTSGMAFFLFNLYDVTKEKIFFETGKAALLNAIEASSINHKNNFSFYTGTAGVAYSLIKAGQITGIGKYFEDAQKLIENIPGAEFPDLHFDYMHGHSGTITFLIWAAKILNNKSFLEKAEVIADKLMQNAIQFPNAISWPDSKENNTIHTGFGHGASGGAYAFSVLFKATGNSRYLAIAKQCLVYEDQHFDLQNGCWNMRNARQQEGTSTPEENVQMGWCYGAAGMGLARLGLFAVTGDPEAKQMLDVACNLALTSRKTTINFSLCHGHLSNAELLLASGKFLSNNQWSSEAYEIADLGIREFHQKDRPWSCGSTTGHSVPPFMTGLAGIGNFYLRLVQPEKYASGLFFDELL